MVAADIFARIREFGATLVLTDGGEHAHLRIGAIPVPPSLLEEIRTHKDEVRAIALAEQKALAIARAIREQRFPLPEPQVCDFLIGSPGETCRRCGASWMEHFPPPPPTRKNRQ